MSTRHDAKGHEVLDKTPVAVPVGWSPPPSLQETIKRLIRHELSAKADSIGYETYDEADDFDVDDDPELKSPYELTADQELAQRLPPVKAETTGVQPVPTKEAPAKPSPSPEGEAPTAA
ncbi:MAG: hypothetical protein [Microviridae sp.]|nr:MAG: hypothetical protein [Microviridae sp.]